MTHAGDLDQRRLARPRATAGTTAYVLHGLARRPLSGQTVTVDYATADGTATAAERLHGELGHADLRPRRDDADGHRAGQRRHHGGAERDVHREPHGRHQRDDRRRPRASARSSTTTPPPNISINDVSLPRATAGTTAFDFTVTLSAAQRPAGDGRLRDRRRHGHRAERLHGELRHADLRPRRDHADGHRARSTATPWSSRTRRSS